MKITIVNHVENKSIEIIGSSILEHVLTDKRLSIKSNFRSGAYKVIENKDVSKEIIIDMAYATIQLIQKGEPGEKLVPYFSNNSVLQRKEVVGGYKVGLTESRKVLEELFYVLGDKDLDIESKFTIIAEPSNSLLIKRNEKEIINHKVKEGED